MEAGIGSNVAVRTLKNHFDARHHQTTYHRLRDPTPERDAEARERGCAAAWRAVLCDGGARARRLCRRLWRSKRRAVRGQRHRAWHAPLFVRSFFHHHQLRTRALAYAGIAVVVAHAAYDTWFHVQLTHWKGAFFDEAQRVPTRDRPPDHDPVRAPASANASLVDEATAAAGMVRQLVGLMALSVAVHAAARWTRRTVRLHWRHHVTIAYYGHWRELAMPKMTGASQRIHEDVDRVTLSVEQLFGQLADAVFTAVVFAPRLVVVGGQIEPPAVWRELVGWSNAWLVYVAVGAALFGLAGSMLSAYGLMPREQERQRHEASMRRSLVLREAFGPSQETRSARATRVEDAVDRAAGRANASADGADGADGADASLSERSRTALFERESVADTGRRFEAAACSEEVTIRHMRHATWSDADSDEGDAGDEGDDGAAPELPQQGVVKRMSATLMGASASPSRERPVVAPTKTPAGSPTGSPAISPHAAPHASPPASPPSSPRAVLAAGEGAPAPASVQTVALADLSREPSPSRRGRRINAFWASSGQLSWRPGARKEQAPAEACSTDGWTGGAVKATPSPLGEVRGLHGHALAYRRHGIPMLSCDRTDASRPSPTRASTMPSMQQWTAPIDRAASPRRSPSREPLASVPEASESEERFSALAGVERAAASARKQSAKATRGGSRRPSVRAATGTPRAPSPRGGFAKRTLKPRVLKGAQALGFVQGTDGRIATPACATRASSPKPAPPPPAPPAPSAPSVPSAPPAPILPQPTRLPNTTATAACAPRSTLPADAYACPPSGSPRASSADPESLRWQESAEASPSRDGATPTTPTTPTTRDDESASISVVATLRSVVQATSEYYGRLLYSDAWSNLFEHALWVIPYVIMLPRVFDPDPLRRLRLGAMMQAVHIFERVAEALGTVATQWTAVNQLASIVERLLLFESELVEHAHRRRRGDGADASSSSSSSGDDEDDRVDRVDGLGKAEGDDGGHTRGRARARRGRAACGRRWQRAVERAKAGDDARVRPNVSFVTAGGGALPHEASPLKPPGRSCVKGASSWSVCTASTQSTQSTQSSHSSHSSCSTPSADAIDAIDAIDAEQDLSRFTHAVKGNGVRALQRARRTIDFVRWAREAAHETRYGDGGPDGLGDGRTAHGTDPFDGARKGSGLTLGLGRFDA